MPTAMLKEEKIKLAVALAKYIVFCKEIVSNVEYLCKNSTGLSATPLSRASELLEFPSLAKISCLKPFWGKL